MEAELADEKYYFFSLKDNENKINIFFDKSSYDLIGWQTEDIYQNLVVTFVSEIKLNQNIDKNIFNLPSMN